MRLAVLTFAAILAVSIGACGGEREVEIDGDLLGSVDQEEFRFLAKGEFIDSRPVNGSLELSWDFPGDGSLPALVADADAIGVLEMLQVVDVTNIPSPPLELERPAVGLVYTTYRAKAEQWIKGGGDPELLLTELGGISPEQPEFGPIFSSGDFLLEPGRKYVLLLWEKSSESPGTGQYWSGAGGRGGFEVTDGLVHVLNHPIAQDLQERYGGMPLADFVGVIESMVAGTYVEEPLAIAPEPSGVSQSSSGPLIDTVAIDTDVKKAPPNTATRVGSSQTCNTLTVGGTLAIDITVDAVPPIAGGEGGITGFQFILVYDAGVVKVTVSDADMLLTVNPGASLVSLGDAAPDADGSFLVAVSDFSDDPGESGEGVLVRVTLEGVGSGLSDLTLTDLEVSDTSNSPYTFAEVLAAQVAVDAPCP